ncbi:MAG TPA: peptide-methionine (R)-S-oxide reductase, partial [bacterium]|nr:peptide-methionine (R)-S-oxide reductase [bacterium]
MRKILIVFLLTAIGTGSAYDESKSDKIALYDSAKGEVVLVSKIKKSNEQWKKELTPEQYHILREKGTERAFTGHLHKHHQKGVYK